MREKDLPEAMQLLEARGKISETLKKIEESDSWTLSLWTGQVPNSNRQDAIHLSKSDSHPLFHQMREMAHKYWLDKYKVITDRLKEIGVDR